MYENLGCLAINWEKPYDLIAYLDLSDLRDDSTTFVNIDCFWVFLVAGEVELELVKLTSHLMRIGM